MAEAWPPVRSRRRNANGGVLHPCNVIWRMGNGARGADGRPPSRRDRPSSAVKLSLPGRSAAAAGTAAAATAALRRRRRGASPAADRDRGQQLHRVVVALGARARRGRLAHRAGPLEGVAAGAASVLVSRHEPSVIARTPVWPAQAGPGPCIWPRSAFARPAEAAAVRLERGWMLAGTAPMFHRCDRAGTAEACHRAGVVSKIISATARPRPSGRRAGGQEKVREAAAAVSRLVRSWAEWRSAAHARLRPPALPAPVLAAPAVRALRGPGGRPVHRPRGSRSGWSS